MNRLILPLRLLITSAIVLAAACGDDDTTPDEGENEEEVITTVQATFTGGGQTLTATWRDADGDGGADPTITNPGAFTVNETYEVSLEFINELESPPEDITEEIREEAEEHLVFFVVSGNLGTVMITDTESDYAMNLEGDDLPVGLAASFTPSTAGSGTMNIVLKHLPPEGGVIQKTPTTTINDGESDVDVTFDITVQ